MSSRGGDRLRSGRSPARVFVLRVQCLLPMLRLLFHWGNLLPNLPPDGVKPGSLGGFDSVGHPSESLDDGHPL